MEQRVNHPSCKRESHDGRFPAFWKKTRRAVTALVPEGSPTLPEGDLSGHPGTQI